MTDEYLRAMQELWTAAAPSFAGKYTQFSGLTFEPKPVQKPHPPIWVGGHSRAALRRTVEIGAAWHPINRPPAELRAGQAEIARLCQARGRAVPPALTLRNDIRVLRPGQSAPASSHGGRVMAGEPAALVDQIGELAGCGVEHLVLEFLAADGRELDEQLTTFAERVRPQLGVSPESAPRMAARRSGSGPDLVLFHGGHGLVAPLDPQRRAARQRHFTVHALDHPSYGDSAPRAARDDRRGLSRSGARADRRDVPGRRAAAVRRASRSAAPSPPIWPGDSPRA